MAGRARPDEPPDHATWNQRNNGRRGLTVNANPRPRLVPTEEGEVVYTTIAWATDGSPSALNALTVATGLARQFGAKLVIIHVEEVALGRGSIFVEPNEAAVAALHRTAQQLRDEGIDTTVSVSRVPASAAAQAIIDLAAEAGADMIVVGNRGHGPLAGLVLGSVALRLLQAAPSPILMVPSRRSTGTPAVVVPDAAPAGA
jgi:nucleotide-binding universal stress UspA family protein